MFLMLVLTTSARAGLPDSTRTIPWYVPHFIPLQFAGNIGLLSTGMGYTSNKQNYELAILYGYVPASVALKNVHTITAKNVFPITRYGLKSNQMLVPYVGLGLSLEIGGNAFLKLPDHYPEKYYRFPKAVHVIGFAGVKLQHTFQAPVLFFRGVDAYAETGTVDVYVWYKAISEHIKFHQIFSLALGINFLINY